jgi:hypothetical protein
LSAYPQRPRALRALRLTSILASLVALLAGGATASAPARIVFESFRTDHGIAYDLRMINADGTGFARVPGPAGSRAEPALSPDRSKIAYAATSTLGYFLRVQVLGTDRPTILRTAGKQIDGMLPAWSPDGKRIAYAGVGGLYVVAATGGKPKRLAIAHVDARPAWSPDGTRIAFSERVQASRYSADTFIRIIGANGTGLTTIKGLPVLPDYPAWSPDGSLIAFSAPAPGGNPQVFVVHPDGSSLKQLTDVTGGARAPAWSPDGTMLAVSTSGDLDSTSVSLVNADGTGLRELKRGTGPAASYHLPDW